MFYDTFTNLCAENNVTPNKVLVDCSISRTSVAKWKKGAVPNGATLEKLADYFGVSVDYLLGIDETKKAPAEDGGRMVDLDEFSFGFFETFNGLTEENQMKLKELAEMFKRDQEQRKREK